jgi:hypothetical protein
VAILNNGVTKGGSPEVLGAASGPASRTRQLHRSPPKGARYFDDDHRQLTSRRQLAEGQREGRRPSGGHNGRTGATKAYGRGGATRPIARTFRKFALSGLDAMTATPVSPAIE